MDCTNEAVSILKEQAGELDLQNKRYLLLTPDAHMILSIDEDEETVKVEVCGGSLEVFETEKRPFASLYGNEV